MQTEILDFEDVEEQLNLNQFTLDDFRAQLLNYLHKYEPDLKNEPLGLYAVTASQTIDGKNIDIEPGVIFCLRQLDEGQENEKLNPIYPYYLVHLSNEGKASIGFTNPKRILEHFSALCAGKECPKQDLYNWFDMETANGSNMTFYNILLQEGLDSIQKAYNRSINDQMDASGSDFLLPIADEQVTETTEFELITRLVITEG